MRMQIAIDDDVLSAAQTLAAQENRSIGDIISDLARRSLHRDEARVYRNGVPLLKVQPGARPVTVEMVNQLRDEAS